MNKAENKGTQVLPAWADKVGKILRLINSISPTFAARLMAILWFKPFMPKSKLHVRQWYDSANHIVPLSFNNAYIFGKIDRPLVLCVHGWRGRGHQLRRFVDPLLAKGFCVAMINLPAHGDRGKNRTDIYECADMVNEVWDKVAPIDSIIAHSFGCPVSVLSFSEKYKPRKLAIIAGNFDIVYLLEQYAAAFNLGSLAGKISQQIRMICDKHIFKGSWDQLSNDTMLEKIKGVETRFWHDPTDVEINVAVNVELSNHLVNSSVIDVPRAGHFNILKLAYVIDSVCDFIELGVK